MNYDLAFEQIEQKDARLSSGESIANTALYLGKLAMNFTSIKRMPRYETGERENDVEHSFMLALVAPELAAALELPLDSGKISQYAIVHDLVETKTGDIPTFSISEAALTAKRLAEHHALTELTTELPPQTAATLLNYEAQVDSEARFVKFVDKLLPLVVDIIGQGVRVVQEDYNTSTEDELRNCHDTLHTRYRILFGDEFPDILAAHAILAELFTEQFATKRNYSSDD